MTNTTNQPTTFTDYISIRITVPHNEFDKIKSSVLFDRSYIAYPHTGKAGTNPHYHCFVPSDNLARDAECLRNRIKRAFGAGNQTFSVVKKSNGIEQAVQYGRREGTMPIVSDEYMQGVVDASPAWVEPVNYVQTMIPEEEDVRKKPRKLNDWQLTYANLVPQAVHHARVKSLTGGLKSVVEDMIGTTKWVPSPYMAKNGVPEFYENLYEYRTGKRARVDMSWWTPKF